MDLFETSDLKSSQSRAIVPLADRLRPGTLDRFLGQSHLVGPGRVLRKIIESDNPQSMIFWGPPGVGKTTLARILAKETAATFFGLSAVTAGLAEVRKIIEQAKINRIGLKKRTILFIDEIHRFNKAQQDALLHSVEDGTIIFVGATTENPSFEVIPPLLSRCRVFKLEPLNSDEIRTLLMRALESKETPDVDAPANVLDALVDLSGGDGRAALNGLELCIRLAEVRGEKRILSLEQVRDAMQRQTLLYDKGGDYHYDTISAFIKSMRGSDPDAAVYWMARMLESGEDPLFIARRMLILASEDVGNADPYALVLANAAFQAVHAVGMPEARIILAQAATYLASAPKSNASYLAVSEAAEEIRQDPDEAVPMHLRNAPTGLMKRMGYSKGYQYAHDHPDGFVEMQNLPDSLKARIFYRPKDIGNEKSIRERLEKWWPKRRSKNGNNQSAEGDKNK